MNNQADFLVEIHTEELPPKTLNKLAEAFLSKLTEEITKAKLAFSEAKSFGTPRRLAVLIKNLTTEQGASFVERKGPAYEAAFDKEGNPTPACIGFARSCSITPKDLIKLTTANGEWVGFRQSIPGKSAKDILPSLVKLAISALPIAKPMRWGNNLAEFVRPVHSVILLLGKESIDAEILGCKTGRKTKGHRFLSKGWLDITEPLKYSSILEKAYVIPDFETRKKRIRDLAQEKAANVLISEKLLEEVTGLVEWPVAIMGQFDEKFLDVPQEVLISAMQDHQRYFPVLNPEGKLLSQFVAIINIESEDVQKVIEGNERVLRARLADAAFFFEMDKKQNFENRLETLKNIIFQNKLGNLYEKSKRISALAGFIAKALGADEETAKKAGLLAKADLTTELVQEFPELQGVVGYYYALKDGLDKTIAISIKEHYNPRYSGDTLPTVLMANIIALADRLDTLIGIFGINQEPSGDKDPFGLRRAALSILRILIEKRLNLDLLSLLTEAAKNYSIPLENKNVINDVLNFIYDRLKSLYQDQGITLDVLASVTSLNITRPYDLDCRIKAVNDFKKLSASESLSVANKRVSNILNKYTHEIALVDIDETLFETDAERLLGEALKEQQSQISILSGSAQYQKVLTQLAQLREPVDNFFEKVLVMTEDKPRRENRLLMLKKLRALFLQVADIALLQ